MTFIDKWMLEEDGMTMIGQAGWPWGDFMKWVYIGGEMRLVAMDGRERRKMGSYGF